MSDIQQRRRLFESFVDSAADAALSIDGAYMLPSLQPAVNGMTTVRDKAFMVDVDHEGRVSIPVDMWQQDGVAFLPLLSEEEVLTADPSVKLPMPSRIGFSADLSGLTPEAVSERTLQKLESDTNAGWTDKLALMGADALTVSYSNDFDEEQIHVVSRPLVLISPFNLEIPTTLQGSNGVHELTHVYDNQQTRDCGYKTPEQQVDSFVVGELRAYHLECAVLQSNWEMLLAQVGEDELRKHTRSTIAVEALRRKHASVEEPFAPIKPVVEKMSKWFHLDTWINVEIGLK